jgi:hypothetical protein
MFLPREKNRQLAEVQPAIALQRSLAPQIDLHGRPRVLIVGTATTLFCRGF